jgi:hypothetical protein
MRFRSLLAIVALVGVVLAGCGDDDEPTGAGDTTTTTAPDDGDGDDGGETVELTITAVDYEFEDVPDEIEGGLIDGTLQNDGEQTHEAFFIRVSDDAAADLTAEQFGEDFGPVLEGGPFPDYFEGATGLGEAEGGESASSTFTLPAGEYAMLCVLSDSDGEGGEDGAGEDGAGEDGAGEDGAGEDGAGEDGAGEDGEEAPPHFLLGMFQMVTVTGPDSVDPPESDATVTASDYTFDFDGLEAGSNAVTFTNDGPDEFHHAVVFGFEEGVDEAQAREAFDAFAAAEESGEPPPEGTPEPDEVGFTQVFSPGMGGTFELELEEGRVYAFLCFISDREGGPPHAFAHDMISFHTVDSQPGPLSAVARRGGGGGTPPPGRPAPAAAGRTPAAPPWPPARRPW